MKNFKFFLLAAAGAFLISCGGGSYDYDDSYLDDYVASTSLYVDNSADTNVFVTLTSIDTDTTFEIEVPSYSLEYISVPYGKYKVDAITCLDSVIIDGEEIFMNQDDYTYSYNLNLSKEDYIMENMKYMVETEASALDVITSDFTYKGETYEGIDATVIPGALLVPNQWDYNLDDDYPEEVEVSAGYTSTTKTKLYRASTFVLYLTLYEIFGDYEEGGEESLW